MPQPASHRSCCALQSHARPFSSSTLLVLQHTCRERHSRKNSRGSAKEERCGGAEERCAGDDQRKEKNSMSGIISWWGFDQDMNAHPVSPRQLFRSKFLIGAHVGMHVHVCKVLLFCCHAALQIPFCLKKIKTWICACSPLRQKSELKKKREVGNSRSRKFDCPP